MAVIMERLMNGKSDSLFISYYHIADAGGFISSMGGPKHGKDLRTQNLSWPSR